MDEEISVCSVAYNISDLRHTIFRNRLEENAPIWYDELNIGLYLSVKT